MSKIKLSVMIRSLYLNRRCYRQAFLLEHRATSSILESLAAPRGALAKQHSQQPQRRTSRGSIVLALGGALSEAFTLEGSYDREVLKVTTSTSNASASDTKRKICKGYSKAGGSSERSYSSENKGDIDCSSSYSPMSEYHCLPDAERISSETRDVGIEGSIAGGGGEGVQRRGICGEAWGSADVVGRKGAEVDHNEVGSSRGGKSATSLDAWAWAGVSGCATRGDAMLTAYGLQPDKLNPMCPSGTPGTGTVRHDRWQRISSVGYRENRGADAGGSRGKDSTRNNQIRKEGGCGNGGCARGGRNDERSSSRTASAHDYQGFRGGKSYKQRLSVASSRVSSTTRRSGRSPSVVRRVACASSRWGEGRSMALTKVKSPHQLIDGEMPRNHGKERGAYPPGNIRQALVDLLVPPSDSLPDAVQPTPKPRKDGQVCETTETDVSVARVPSGQVATPTMDGRGGTAAPPHRPHQLTLVAPATSASYAAVFPDLKTMGGTGGEMLVAFESDRSRGQRPGWSDANCADKTKAIMSRSREHPPNWQGNSKKISPGYPGKLLLGSNSARLHHALRTRPLTGEGKSGSGTRSGAVASPGVVSMGTAHSCRGISDDLLYPIILAAGVEAVERSPATPPLALIEHFKQAPRPASRRGTRKQGAEGDVSPPAPALCLFSGHRGGQGERFTRAGGALEWRRKG